MKKYLYLLAGLAAGFVLVFMGTAICQYLHLTQSGYVRYDDSVEVVYQQVAEYAGVDPATLSIHAKRQVGDDIFVLWKTPECTRFLSYPSTPAVWNPIRDLNSRRSS